jgi:hypothetical protein
MTILVYFTPIGNILWPFGIFCDKLVYFSTFWYFWTQKNLATLPEAATHGFDRAHLCRRYS